MTPKRIQRKRTKGWRMPPNTKYVGRGSKYGNDWKIGCYVHTMSTDPKQNGTRLITRELSLELYQEQIRYDHEQIKKDLKGFNLACWCKLEDTCHADILLRIANEKEI